MGQLTMDYNGKKVLVTGASGFIGQRLCRYLSEQHAEIHAISRLIRTTPEADIRWWQGDLADEERVEALFAAVKPDIVFHLASEVTGGRDLSLIMPTFRCNLMSAVNILVAAERNECQRVVMAGSLEEPDQDDINAVPCSPYAAAKWAANGYARMFHALYGTSVVIARLFMVYGPGQQDLRKLIPYVTLSLLRGEQPKLSSGRRPVDWIYVNDVVTGLLNLGHVPGVDGAVVDLGFGELVTTREVVETLRDIIGGPQPEFGALPERPMERVKAADVGATYRMLGWKPAVPLREGLQKTVEWYQSQLKTGNC